MGVGVGQLVRAALRHSAPVHAEYPAVLQVRTGEVQRFRVGAAGCEAAGSDETQAAWASQAELVVAVGASVR